MDAPHDDKVNEDLQLFDWSYQKKDKNNGNTQPGLTSRSTREYLQSMANLRDDNNRGMTRKEMNCFIAEIETVSMKCAENYYNHSICSKQIPDLKRNGRVVSAQTTTINWTAIMTTRLLCTHITLVQCKFVSVTLFCILFDSTQLYYIVIYPIPLLQHGPNKISLMGGTIQLSQQRKERH